ncbi:Hepatocyte Nuclear Factor 4-Alpha [Manis pentadactyla]|nr:Hepatocyte Nuclear Factor 4-Alpha [Manis pentadactyla]
MLLRLGAHVAECVIEGVQNHLLTPLLCQWPEPRASASSHENPPPPMFVTGRSLTPRPGRDGPRGDLGWGWG